MNRYCHKKLTPFFLFSFLLYTSSACSGSESTRHLDKYDSRPYHEIAKYSFAREVVHKAAIFALQQKGYVVTLSDPQSGLLNGELQASHVIAEEQKAAEHSEGPSAGSILIAILGVIFLFGIIALLTGPSDSSEQPDDTKARDRSREPSSTYHSDAKSISYRYIVTLNLSSVDSASTEVEISAVRTVLEDGSVSSSGRIENKYLNYSMFDSIQARLETVK